MVKIWNFPKRLAYAFCQNLEILKLFLPYKNGLEQVKKS